MADLVKTSTDFFVHVDERDLIAELLADKRSANTRRAYAIDLRYFFEAIAPGKPLCPDLVAAFLQLERATALGLTLNYKAGLIAQNLAENTINRRLAAIKSLVLFANKLDKCAWTLDAIEGEKVISYRDTTGISAADYQKLLLIPDRSTAKGARDYALLRLLWENALRRGELVKCNVGDLSPDRRSLKIYGKGRGNQQEAIALSEKIAQAIGEWLDTRGPLVPTDPLFTAVDNANSGRRLTGDGIYHMVRSIAQAAGIQKSFSPHRCRHSSITAALDATNGDVRRVQKLSRHRKLDTLMIYDDNRSGLQGQVTDQLSGLV